MDAKALLEMGHEHLATGECATGPVAAHASVIQGELGVRFLPDGVPGACGTGHRGGARAAGWSRRADEPTWAIRLRHVDLSFRSRGLCLLRIVTSPERGFACLLWAVPVKPPFRFLVQGCHSVNPAIPRNRILRPLERRHNFLGLECQMHGSQNIPRHPSF